MRVLGCGRVGRNRGMVVGGSSFTIAFAILVAHLVGNGRAVGSRCPTPPGGVETGEGVARLDRLPSHAGTFFSLSGFSGSLSVGSASTAARGRPVGGGIAAKGLRTASGALAHRSGTDAPMAVPPSAADPWLAPAPFNFPAASVRS